MANFQGSGFALNMPDEFVDATAYCFAFPQVGDFAPNLTVQFERRASPPELVEELEKLQRSLKFAVDGFSVLSQATYQSANGPYVFSVSEWGPADARIRQMHVLLYGTAGKPTLYTLTATDRADNFAKSEPLFRQVMGSFAPNDQQCF